MQVVINDAIIMYKNTLIEQPMIQNKLSVCENNLSLVFDFKMLSKHNWHKPNSESSGCLTLPSGLTTHKSCTEARNA